MTDALRIFLRDVCGHPQFTEMLAHSRAKEFLFQLACGALAANDMFLKGLTIRTRASPANTSVLNRSECMRIGTLWDMENQPYAWSNHEKNMDASMVFTTHAQKG